MSPGAPVLEIAPDVDRVVKSIVVIYAMAAEAAPLVEYLELKKVEPTPFPKGAPWALYSGGHDGVEVNVLVPGKDRGNGVDNVGTVPSAVLTYAAVEKLKPDLIVNAGTAGGFKGKGAAIGDVYLATQMANHDRRIPLPGFDKYGVGQISAFPTPNLLKALQLKAGAVSTGNSFDMTEMDLKFIQGNNAVVKDMESAAVAWVAHILDVPMIAIKSVTDIVDGDRPTTEEFLENLAAAATSLKQTVPKVVSFVSGKKFHEL
eukprot:jgi/Mesen1/5666/ME000288S04877